MTDAMLPAEADEQTPEPTGDLTDKPVSEAVIKPAGSPEGEATDVAAVPVSEQEVELPSIPAVELTLPAILGFEKVARSAATALAEEMGFSSDRIEDLKTAVSEACMNATEHGNGGDATAKVHVVLRAGPTQLEVMVNDQAQDEMPNPLPAPGLPDGTRGWGLFFITQLMDEVTFRRLPEGGNQVHMLIRLQKPQELTTSPAELPTLVEAAEPAAEHDTSVDSAGPAAVDKIAAADGSEEHATPPDAAPVQQPVQGEE